MTFVGPRQHRMLWIVTDDYRVVRATGYSCPDPKDWWFPSERYTLILGIHAFETEHEAIRRALRDIATKQEALQVRQDSLRRRAQELVMKDSWDV